MRGRGDTAARLLGALLLGGIATSAGADEVIGAKLRCQTEYRDLDLDAACERGVDLAKRTPQDLARAAFECARGSDEARVAACRRGTSLYARVADARRGERSTSFSYSWRQGHGAARLPLGSYDVFVGDAERSMEECLHAFEGSATPPSCLSGLRVQPGAPSAPPTRPAAR